MEVFKRILERTIAVERSKVACRTRRACSKQITDLEGVVSKLRAQLTVKDANISSLTGKVRSLDNEIAVKKDELYVLEREIVMIKKVLEDKDKQTESIVHELTTLATNHTLLEEKFMLQSKTLAAAQRQLATARLEGDDLSLQLWQLVEENCNANKRILQLDMEVHSLEELLTRAKSDLEKAEQKSEVLVKDMEKFRVGYETKSREIIEVGTRERNLQAMVINLSGELDQWKRNSKWDGDAVCLSEGNDKRNTKPHTSALNDNTDILDTDISYTQKRMSPARTGTSNFSFLPFPFSNNAFNNGHFTNNAIYDKPNKGNHIGRVEVGLPPPE